MLAYETDIMKVVGFLKLFSPIEMNMMGEDTKIISAG
jgi:hypothetical protein